MRFNQNIQRIDCSNKTWHISIEQSTISYRTMFETISIIAITKRKYQTIIICHVHLNVIKKRFILECNDNDRK